MGLLDWFLHRDRGQVPVDERARINETLERILRIVPRLRNARRYRERLAPAIAASLRYVDDLVASLPACHEANANAWSSDSHVRAFFATPNDLITAFSVSEELRAYFDRNSDLPEAYAALGMAMTERHVLGVALEGDTTRYDVEQTTLCFGDYSVRICGRTESDLHEEIGRRMVDQLALEGLGKLAVDRRELLAQGRELLQVRLVLLEHQGAGMRSVVGGGLEASSEELARVRTRIEENARHLADLRAPTVVIEHELERVCEVLSAPSSHIYITKKRFRLDLMNVVRDGSAQASREIDCHVARIPGDPPGCAHLHLCVFLGWSCCQPGCISMRQWAGCKSPTQIRNAFNSFRHHWPPRKRVSLRSRVRLSTRIVRTDSIRARSPAHRSG